MNQEIRIDVFFPDLFRTVKIQNVYQINNKLIVVSKIKTTGNITEGTRTRIDTTTVITHSKHELPVEHYIINDLGRTIALSDEYREVQSLEEITVIDGYEPLEAIEKPPIAAGYLLLFTSSSDDEDNEPESKHCLPCVLKIKS